MAFLFPDIAALQWLVKSQRGNPALTAARQENEYEPLEIPAFPVGCCMSG